MDALCYADNYSGVNYARLYNYIKFSVGWACTFLFIVLNLFNLILFINLYASIVFSLYVRIKMWIKWISLNLFWFILKGK